MTDEFAELEGLAKLERAAWCHHSADPDDKDVVDELRAAEEELDNWWYANRHKMSEFAATLRAQEEEIKRLREALGSVGVMSAAYSALFSAPKYGEKSEEIGRMFGGLSETASQALKEPNND